MVMTRSKTKAFILGSLLPSNFTPSTSDTSPVRPPTRSADSPRNPPSQIPTQHQPPSQTPQTNSHFPFQTPQLAPQNIPQLPSQTPRPSPQFPPQLAASSPITPNLPTPPNPSPASVITPLLSASLGNLSTIHSISSSSQSTPSTSYLAPPTRSQIISNNPQSVLGITALPAQNREIPDVPEEEALFPRPIEGATQISFSNNSANSEVMGRVFILDNPQDQPINTETDKDTDKTTNTVSYVTFPPDQSKKSGTEATKQLTTKPRSPYVFRKRKNAETEETELLTVARRRRKRKGTISGALRLLTEKEKKERDKNVDEGNDEKHNDGEDDDEDNNDEDDHDDEDDQDDAFDDEDFENMLIQTLDIASPYISNDATTIAAEHTITRVSVNSELLPNVSTPKRN